MSKNDAIRIAVLAILEMVRQEKEDVEHGLEAVRALESVLEPEFTEPCGNESWHISGSCECFGY